MTKEKQPLAAFCLSTARFALLCKLKQKYLFPKVDQKISLISIEFKQGQTFR